MNFSTKKLSEVLGLEIINLNLKDIIEDKDKTKLQKLFVENSVLVIRNQNLNANEFQKCAEVFGEVFKQHNSRFALKENLKCVFDIRNLIFRKRFSL